MTDKGQLRESALWLLFLSHLHPNSNVKLSAVISLPYTSLSFSDSFYHLSSLYFLHFTQIFLSLFTSLGCSVTGVTQLLKCVKEMTFCVSPECYLLFAVEMCVLLTLPAPSVASFSNHRMHIYPPFYPQLAVSAPLQAGLDLCVKQLLYCWKEKTSCVWKSICYILCLDTWNVCFPFNVVRLNYKYTRHYRYSVLERKCKIRKEDG